MNDAAIATPLATGPTSGAGAAPAPRRRRLWQLPTQAHELLLAMSFTPEALRREAARTLGQVHKGRCVLKGRDVDVLYSVVHDLATRNPLAEAFHKHLEQRHALAVRRLAALREAAAVQAAWARALQDDEVPGMLWALLTHPLGATLEAAALYDARDWVFALARRSLAQTQAQEQAQARERAARQQAEALRARLTDQQRQAAQALAQAQAEIARLSGELARARAAASATPPQADRAPGHPHRAFDGFGDPLDARPRARPPKSAGPTPAPHAPNAPDAPDAPDAQAVPPCPAAPQPARPAAAPVAPASPPIVVRGRRVLCVGGIRHAVARYRLRIEQLGGQFEHHDGGIEDGVQALEGRLGRADVVICQAACINHEAYHRVKRHCERTGKPCVYLDRPSLSRFDRAITPLHCE